MDLIILFLSAVSVNPTHPNPSLGMGLVLKIPKILRKEFAGGVLCIKPVPEFAM